MQKKSSYVTYMYFEYVSFMKQFFLGIVGHCCVHLGFFVEHIYVNACFWSFSRLSVECYD